MSSWPFDAYQTIMLLIAGAGALAGYVHVRYDVKQHTKQIDGLNERQSSTNDRLHAMELAHAGHIGSMEEIIKNLKETLADMRKELGAQREITLQLERAAIRQSAGN